MDRDELLRQRMQATLDDLAGAREPLDVLSDFQVLDEFVNDYAQARVDDARAAGASWSQIAARLGVSRQAAHKRFGARGKAHRALELRLVWEKDQP